MEKIKKFLDEHKATFQFIKFTLISMIAAVVELVSYFILMASLKSLNNQEFHWFIFRYEAGEAGGLAAMISFLVSTTLAQIVSFIINRKKTFEANNNLAFSITMYVLMMLFIIGIQTYTGPMLIKAIDNGIHNSGVASFIGKFFWMAMSFAIVFPMNKFVIMRKKSEEIKETSNVNEDGREN